MSRSVKKVAKARCRWCGADKRHRYPERADCEGCNPKHRKGRARRERRP